MSTTEWVILPIELPPPKEISEGQIHITQRAKQSLKSLLSLPRDLNGHDLEKYLKEVLELFSASQGPDKQPMQNPEFSRLQREHEHYFDITRYEAITGDLMVENIVLSYYRLIADYNLGSSLSIIDLGHIDCALRNFAQYLLCRLGEDHGNNEK